MDVTADQFTAMLYVLMSAATKKPKHQRELVIKGIKEIIQDGDLVNVAIEALNSRDK